MWGRRRENETHSQLTASVVSPFPFVIPFPFVMRLRWLMAFSVAVFGVSAATVIAQATPGQPAPASKLKLDTGKEIYEAGCIACHGPSGRG